MSGRGLAAVTGATGFLGQHLIRALADAGWQVRILARRDPVSPFWPGVAPQVVIGDLGDPAALNALCRGADLVIHSAALLAGRKADLDRVNIDGSARLAEAARAAGVARTVLVSSLAARAPHLSAYAASKRGAETAARAILGPQLTIVRPPAVYGPGDRETLALFRMAAISPVLPVLDPRARIALVHVQDAARQIVAAAELGAEGPFALSDDRPEGHRWEDIMQAAAKTFGRTPRLVRIPLVAVYALASAPALSNVWRRKPGVLTFAKVTELTYSDWGIRPEERAPLIPAIEFNILRGFAQTVGWAKSAGWL